MNQPEPRPNVNDGLTAEEMARVPHEAWLPAETLLVAGSLALGGLLLGLLLWASARFFPTP